MPYLVRRLLENGANSSFVHALLDEKVPPEEVVSDPISAVERHPERHRRIPTPPHLYGEGRLNSKGYDLTRAEDIDVLLAALAELDRAPVQSGPIVGGYLAGLQLPLAWNFMAFSCAAVLAAVFVILIPGRYAGGASAQPAAGARTLEQQRS